MDYQKLLLQHLDLIDRVVHFIARRHHLSAPDTDEFASVVRFKLIDHDFAILRKFEGRSNLATYLTTVIERLYLDFCIARWGKWRPSAQARKLGAVAVLLEQMVRRDGYSFEEAVGTLQTNHHVTESRDALQAVLAQLPVRPVRRLAGEEELAIISARGGAADAAFDEADDQATMHKVENALTEAVATLPTQDQLIIQLRFHQNVPVAQIARVLGTEPKPLYRRLEQIVRALREALQRAGIDPAQINRIVGHPTLTLADVLAPAPSENAAVRPSKA